MSTRTDPTEFVDLFGAVRRAITAVAAEAYATVDLGSAQAKFMRHVGKHPQISQAELARATASDPTLTSRTVTTLISRGLVRRERSATDRREYVVELTAAGKRTYEKIVKLRAALAARIVDALDDQDLADFDRIAAKILGVVEATAR